MSITRKIGVFVALLVFASCGSKSVPDLPILVSPASAFSDSRVVDVVFFIENSDGTLDQDGDGQPDLFVYPSACGALAPAQCGFPTGQTGAVEIGDLPLNFQYRIQISFRDASGASIYEGQSLFVNDGSQSGISVTVTEVTS